MKTKTEFYFIKSSIILTFLVLISCSKSDDSSTTIAAPVVPEGAYIGTWTSTTTTGAVFTDFPIAAILLYNSDNTSVNGQFFVSPKTYTSEVNDGTISMEVDGNIVTSFFLNDTLINCTGTFNGTGEITNEGTFIISFTGTDCDGDHAGEMVFSKVE